MKYQRLTWALVLLAGCVSFDDYTPTAREAWIEDRGIASEDADTIKKTLVLIKSVDGRKIQAGDRVRIRERVALPLQAGSHRLEVEICEAGFYRYCGRAVLHLDATPGTHYRLHGNISKKRNHAEIWVEDAGSGNAVIKPIRVKGLTSTM